MGKKLLSLSLSVMLLLLAGCLPEENGTDEAAGGEQERSDFEVALVLKDKFGVPQGVYAAGFVATTPVLEADDPVSFELSIKNNTDQLQTLNFGCTLHYDFSIFSAEMGQVWQLSESASGGCFAAITSFSLQPGEVHTESFDWNHGIGDLEAEGAPTGGYVVTGWYLGRPESATVSMIIQ
jgi:hypothetical protein